MVALLAGARAEERAFAHGPEVAVSRAWLLAADRPGAVPDTEFGVSKDAGFPYFAKMAYQHSEKYPTARWGTSPEICCPECS